ncbi:hypothetical protein [Vibrio hyugaensis]|uniref:hypothetical protein n=1 Tax=Vibrio hyugaensis TaxID=1534743 RepID=UPI0005EE2DFB|nr:hypothetical protein [Vibrio hyugaensis]
MTKLNFFSSVNKYVFIVGLVTINLVLFVAAEASQVKLIGKVEALGHSWLNHTDFSSGELISKFNYFKISNPSDTSKSVSYHYDDIEFSDGGYITFGLNGVSEVRHTRVFSLDEKCMLFFYGPSKLGLNNVSMRCLY